MSEEAEIYDFAPARAKWLQKVETTKAARKARHQQLVDSVDRRSLRVTGRTAQLNVRCREDVKAKVTEAARASGLSIAEWMERAIGLALAEPTMPAEEMADNA